MPFSQSDLTQVIRRVSLARERLERQRGLIEQLAKSGDDTLAAEAIFRTMRQTLENLEEDRRQIEYEVYSAKAEQG